MKYLLAIVFIITYLFDLSAQYDPMLGLDGLIDKKGDQYFEWAGYDISVTEIKTPKDEKAISKLKKKHKINNFSKEYTNPDIPVSHTVIESVTDFEKGGKKFPDIKIYQLLYIIKKNDNKSDLISFTKLGERDIYIENTFLNFYNEKKLSDYIALPAVETINFIGRTIKLGNACQWRSPHNINCMGGQISWAIFDAPSKASKEIEKYIVTNEHNNSVILDDFDILVSFEEQDVIARRIVYKNINHMRGYPLIVYYLWTELNGKYISCILSHYGYNKDDYELPDLLKEVMQLQEIPEYAWNKYDYPIPDVLTEEQKESIENAAADTKYKHYWINLKSGVYVPLRGQRDFTGTSTYLNLGLYLNGFSDPNSFRDSNSTIFLDFGFVIPSDKKHFNYYEKNEVLDAKTDLLLSMNLGYVHKTKIKSQLYWENHLKIGIAGLTTNKEKPDKKDGNYNVGVFTMGIGTNIRYKRVGVFLDYQFAPYNKSKHLDKGGNSAIIAGLNITF